MNYLGIDYGMAKTGIAYASGKLAEPFVVIKNSNAQEVIKKIQTIINELMIDELVVGVSEGEMGIIQEDFAEKTAIFTGLRVNLMDETLSTYDAQMKSIEAGKGRKKRREMEDAYAAAVILQNWLDEK